MFLLRVAAQRRTSTSSATRVAVLASRRLIQTRLLRRGKKFLCCSLMALTLLCCGPPKESPPAQRAGNAPNVSELSAAKELPRKLPSLRRVQSPKLARLYPLGDAALVAAEQTKPTFALIESGEMKDLPHLNDFAHQADEVGGLVTAGGSWPQDAWFAQSYTSDAGPSWAWIYKWDPGGARDGEGSWRLMREYGRSAGQLVPWQGGVVAVEASPHIAVARKPYAATWLSGSSSSRKELKRGHKLDTLPWWSKGNVLFGVDVECSDALGLDHEMCLEILQLRANEVFHKSTVPFPSASLLDLSNEEWRFFMDGKTPLLVTRAKDSTEDHLLQFDGQTWARGEVPNGFHLLGSQDASLWGIAEARVYRFSEKTWKPLAVFPDSQELLAAPCTSKLESSQVWQAKSGELWLLICGALFSTKGKVSPAHPPFQGGTKSTSDDTDLATCSRLVVDVFTLAGEPVNSDPWHFTPSEARNYLRNKLASHPEFKTLEFVRYNCFDHDCIAAVVPDTETGDRLRGAIESHNHTLSYESEFFCGNHPETTRFPLFETSVSVPPSGTSAAEE